MASGSCRWYFVGPKVSAIISINGHDARFKGFHCRCGGGNW
jgi:hypothetical protein